MNHGRKDTRVKENLRLARQLWPHAITKLSLQSLRSLTNRYAFSIQAGDLLYLEGHWYITHAGLLRLATRNRCAAISVHPVRPFCDPSAGRWIFKATVYKSPRSRGFVGYGDADPSNVSSLVRGAEMRIAETRAVNRALRKAYGIGLCSVEELGSLSSPPKPSATPRNEAKSLDPVSSGNGQPRLRDRLCQLIRKHRLDAALVKQYAADFCQTPNLRDAPKERIEAFIATLAEQATRDRSALLCQLNSYAHPKEDRS